MKSAQFKSKSNEKLNNTKKFKTIKLNKQIQELLIKKDVTSSEVSKPVSSLADDSPWKPSRDWHKYLSGQEEHSALKNASPGHMSTCDGNDGQTYNQEQSLKKPTDELVAIKLPTVNFCDGNGEGAGERPKREIHEPERCVSISDLCYSDKRKIAQLIEQLARCKQEKQEDEEKIVCLKARVSELKTSLKFFKEKGSGNKSMVCKNTFTSEEEVALKRQLVELNALLMQMQVQKATSEQQVRLVTAQAEKLTRAFHSLHRDNVNLQVELKMTKEKMHIAQQAVDRMKKELKDVYGRLKPSTLNQACQSCEEVDHEKVYGKKTNTPEPIHEDQKLLTELFFNKSVQNSHLPNETIIFLPSNSLDPFTSQ